MESSSSGVDLLSDGFRHIDGAHAFGRFVKSDTDDREVSDGDGGVFAIDVEVELIANRLGTPFEDLDVDVDFLFETERLLVIARRGDAGPTEAGITL